MKYLNWNRCDLGLGDKNPDLEKVIIEVDSKGLVSREIGLSNDNKVMYRSSNLERSSEAMFDVAEIEMSNVKNELSAEKFEELWVQQPTNKK